MKFKVILEPAEEGGYNVVVPGIEGCFTQGDNLEDALRNAKKAIEVSLEPEELEKTKPIELEYIIEGEGPGKAKAVA